MFVMMMRTTKETVLRLFSSLPLSTAHDVPSNRHVPSQSYVGVALLEAVVLLDVVKVGAAHDDGVLHLTGGDDHTLQKLATDGHVARERALFFCLI